MGDLGKRIRLIHELGKLRGTEEFLHGRDDGLAVDEIVRLKRGVGILGHGELLLDGPLHADKAHAEAVLKQFTDGPHAAVAQVIDVVRAHWSDVAHLLPGGVVLLQAQKVVDGLDEIIRAQRAGIHFGFQSQLGVEFVAAHLAQVVLLRIEEHAIEQLLAAFHGGGLV